MIVIVLAFPMGARARVPVPPRIALGAGYRTAFIHVPSGYRSLTPTSLVLEFHGAGPEASAAGYLRG